MSTARVTGAAKTLINVFKGNAKEAFKMDNLRAKQSHNRLVADNTRLVKKLNKIRDDKRLGIAVVDDEKAGTTQELINSDLHPHSLVIINKDQTIASGVAGDHDTWMAPGMFGQQCAKLSREERLYSLYADVCQAYIPKSEFRRGVQAFLQGAVEHHKYVSLAITSGWSRRKKGSKKDEQFQKSLALLSSDIVKSGYRVTHRGNHVTHDYQGYRGSTRMLFVAYILERA
jgi:hypothetical protein